MKFKTLFSIVSCCLLSVFSFFSMTSEAATLNQTQSSMINPQTGQPQIKLNNAQILEALMVINSNEIAAAQLAMKKTSNPDVKAFAQMMISDHTQNLQATKKLAKKNHIVPAESMVSDLLTMGGKDEFTQLKTLSGKQFDMAYINAMVKGHAAALKAINGKFLPSASNTDLNNFLKQTKLVVMKHLIKAKMVQKQLMNTATTH